MIFPSQKLQKFLEKFNFPLKIAKVISKNLKIQAFMDEVGFVIQSPRVALVLSYSHSFRVILDTKNYLKRPVSLTTSIGLLGN